MSDTSRVLVGPIDRGVMIKVIGRGTMEFCSQLFDYISQKIKERKKEGLEVVFFDLSEANYLDSSFIGVIVHVDKKIKKEFKEATVIVLNPSPKVKEILMTMGLMEILPIQEDNAIRNLDASQEIQKKLEKDYNDIKLLLESHQNLMEINSENRKRFGLVEEMLKKELERNKNE